MNEGFRSTEVLNKSTFIYTERDRTEKKTKLLNVAILLLCYITITVSLPWALTATAFEMLPAGIHNSKGRLADNRLALTLEVWALH